METRFKYCKQCKVIIGYSGIDYCDKCSSDIYQDKIADFNRAIKIVKSKMFIKSTGQIVCSEEKWETLDFKYKAAVYYLSNEFDFTVIDE